MLAYGRPLSLQGWSGSLVIRNPIVNQFFRRQFDLMWASCRVVKLTETR